MREEERRAGRSAEPTTRILHFQGSWNLNENELVGGSGLEDSGEGAAFNRGRMKVTPAGLTINPIRRFPVASKNIQDSKLDWKRYQSARARARARASAACAPTSARYMAAPAGVSLNSR